MCNNDKCIGTTRCTCFNCRDMIKTKEQNNEKVKKVKEIILKGVIVTIRDDFNWMTIKRSLIKLSHIRGKDNNIKYYLYWYAGTLYVFPNIDRSEELDVEDLTQELDKICISSDIQEDLKTPMRVVRMNVQKEYTETINFTIKYKNCKECIIAWCDCHHYEPF